MWVYLIYQVRKYIHQLQKYIYGYFAKYFSKKREINLIISKIQHFTKKPRTNAYVTDHLLPPQKWIEISFQKRQREEKKKKIEVIYTILISRTQKSLVTNYIFDSYESVAKLENNPGLEVI